MSPTIYRWNGFRFAFFSNEEGRMHLHVIKGEKQAKVWLEPAVAVEYNLGFGSRDLKRLVALIEEHADEFKVAWKKHFKG